MQSICCLSYLTVISKDLCVRLGSHFYATHSCYSSLPDPRVFLKLHLALRAQNKEMVSNWIKTSANMSKLKWIRFLFQRLEEELIKRESAVMYWVSHFSMGGAF